MIKERFEFWLNIRTGEWTDLLFFWVFNLILWTGITIGESLSEAIFLKRVGVEYLPWMFIFCSLLSIPFSLLFTWLQNKIRPVQFSIFLNLLSAMLIFSSTFFLKTNFSIFSLQFGAIFLYFLQNSLSNILNAHFSIILSGHFKTLDAKRLFPLILSGTVTGALIGGLILNQFADNFGTEFLLILWVVFLVLSAMLMFIFKSHLSDNSWSQEESSSPKFQGKNWFDKILNEIRAATDRPLLLFLAISAFLVTVAKFFMEFLYNDIFARSFASESQLAGFYGIYIIVSNILALLFQALFTGRIIQFLGVSNANLFYPISTLLAFGSVYIWYRLPTGVFIRFNQEAIRRAIFQPVSNLFYNAVPSKSRSQAIALNESIIGPIAAIFSGVTLLLIASNGEKVAFLAIILVIPWLFCSWKLKHLYSKSLLDLLKRSRISQISNDEKNLEILDTQTQLLVIEALKDSQNEVVELASELLFTYGQPSARLALLRQAATGRNEVQTIILKKLARFPGSDTKDFILKSLQNPDRMVKLSALESLAQFPYDDEIRYNLSLFLDHEDINFRAIASAGLVRAGDLVAMTKALTILQKLLFSSNPQEIALGIKALGEIREERFWVNLRPFLKSEDSSLRLAAIRSMNYLVKTGEIQEHLEILQNLTKDPIREIRSMAIQIIGRVKTNKSMLLLIECLGDLSPRNRKFALEALSIYGPETIPELLKLIDIPSTPLIKQEGAIRILALSQNPQVREKLASYGKEKIREIYELKTEEKSVRAILSQEESEYLAMVLDEKTKAIIRVILALVTPDRENQAARTVFKSLYSSNEEIMGNAIEVLQSMGERTLIYNILPFLEGLSLEQIVLFGKQLFKFEEKSLKIILERHLLSKDQLLKEAAIYTIGKICFSDLGETLKTLDLSKDCDKEIQRIRIWALSKLGETIKL
ncbi:MAG: HEAT repeat domain-containing protein [Candidatus Riflebacteria bacterium]|nr:HEAT repeat domain-containing protein [Candidatus Riflebacteria bacterium]